MQSGDHVLSDALIFKSKGSEGPQGAGTFAPPAAEGLSPLSDQKHLSSALPVSGLSGLQPGLWGVSPGITAVLSQRHGEGESERKLPKPFSANSPGLCVKDKIVCPMGKYS